jgi:hypothetical protein
MTLAGPTLSVWTIKASTRVISTDMCFMRMTVGYILLDHEGNEIMTELQISQVTKFIEQYRRK